VRLQRVNARFSRSTLLAGAASTALALGARRGSAADLPPLKVGYLGTFSGPYADEDAPLEAAIAAFFKEHGDTVAGRKVTLIKRDDGGPNPENARRLAQELIVNEKVDLMMGLTLSPNALAVGQVTTAAKMPTLVTNSGGYGILEPNPYFARFSFTTGQVTYPLADWASKQKLKNAYILVLDFGPGIDAANTFRTAFTAKGGTILGEVRVPLGVTDMAAYVQRVRDAKPQAVFVFLTVSGRSFLKAWQGSGGDKSGTKILATGDLTLEKFFPDEGDSALGVYTAMNYSPALDAPMNKKLTHDMHAIDASIEYPDFYTVATYDALAAIYKLVAAQNGNIEPEKTMALLRGMKLDSARGPIQIDPQTRDCIQNIYIRRVDKVNGQLQNTTIATYPAVRDPLEK
jgi:branched-chain amino acid transport system substrate-binding protein